MLKDIDGCNQWDALSKDEKSRRTTIEYNIDQIDGTAAVSVDDWKLVTGKINYLCINTLIKSIFKFLTFPGDTPEFERSQVKQTVLNE